MEDIQPDQTVFGAAQGKNPRLLRRMQTMASQGGRKRVFLGLLSVSCFIVCLLLLIFLVLPWFGEAHAWLEAISVFAGATCILLLAWICLTLVYHIYTGRNLPGIGGARHLCIRFFLPLMELAGRVAGQDKNMVRRSFIKVNNEFVCANARAIRPAELLLLLPHCMQASACPRRLDMDLANCAACGQCQLGQIRALAREKGFRVAIATGGTIARRIVAEMRPRQIIAVACERDLTSGIQDSYPLPVFGVLNQRPNGPCRDTLASFPALLLAIEYFLQCPKNS